MSAANVVELTPRQIEAHDDQRDLGRRGHVALREAFRELFPSGAWLLDAGGGSGVAVPALQASGSRVIVVDWSATMLRAARGRAAYRCGGDLRRLPFASATFGGVHAAYAIQNVVEWRLAIEECVRVAAAAAPIVVAWGGPPPDERLAGIEAAYFGALGHAAGVRAQRAGISLDAANDHFAALGRPVRRTVTVQGEQIRTPRQIVERVALNPFRSQPDEVARTRATSTALAWAQANVGPLDEPLTFRAVRVHHVY